MVHGKQQSQDRGSRKPPILRSKDRAPARTQDHGCRMLHWLDIQIRLVKITINSKTLTMRLNSQAVDKLLIYLSSILIAFYPAKILAVSFSPAYNPELERWRSEGIDINAGQILVPIRTDSYDSGIYFLNTVSDLNNDNLFGPYSSQKEWISVNIPIPILPSLESYFSNFFDLNDPSAGGIVNTRILFSQKPLNPSTYPLESWDGSLPGDLGNYIVDDFKTPIINFDRGGDDPLGPTGGGPGSSSGQNRKLPHYINQPPDSYECYISSVAMSFYWMKERYPKVFQNLPSDPNDLLNKMKQSPWWMANGLIPWEDLAAFKRWVLEQYKITGVVVEEWSAAADPHEWIVSEYKKDQDLELSVEYPSGGGHSMIIVGWSIKDGEKWVKVVDPLQATRNSLPVEKLIKLDGVNTSYSGRSTVRAIDAESVPVPAPAPIFGLVVAFRYARGLRNYSSRLRSDACSVVQ